MHSKLEVVILPTEFGIKVRHVSCGVGEAFNVDTVVYAPCIPNIHRKTEDIRFTQFVNLGLKEKEPLIDLFLLMPLDQHVEPTIVVDPVVLPK